MEESMRIKRTLICSFILLLVATMLLRSNASATMTPQEDHILQEAEVVYLGNLARQANGVPPLRWNRQLSEASRWFSWDSVENRPEPYCGHQDSQGNWPGDRAWAFGYRGFAGAENAFCGYVTPQQAIDGWMNSPGHRDNLLSPGSREVGIGYYLRTSDNRGYVTQKFGSDPAFPPVIIENEALSTTTPQVDLYIYDRSPGGGFAELGPATEMKVSNDACFSDATWEHYTPHKMWTLTPGAGWRDVYVQTRDSLGRTVTASDTIYLGDNLPLDELDLLQASTTRETVTIYDLDGEELPQVQMSLNWVVDDTYDTFNLNWGNGERVNDGDALGGTAFRLRPGAGESNAWVWTTQFVKEIPLVAYVRLKVSDNSSPNEVARFSVSGGGVTYGPLSLAGTSFEAANQYQEFALPFTFHDDPDNSFLIFNFWRSGAADVYVDAVQIFTAPTAVTSPLIWHVPGGNYRGQGVWLRYADGAGQFSPITAANLQPQQLQVSPTSLHFVAEVEGANPFPKVIQVSALGCGQTEWAAGSDVDWLTLSSGDDTIEVSVNIDGLAIGSYAGEITIEATGVTAVTVPVNLLIVEEIQSLFLPLISSP
jgi:uncharacterized protein YkwD